jgi:hypothetical protein
MKAVFTRYMRNPPLLIFTSSGTKQEEVGIGCFRKKSGARTCEKMDFVPLLGRTKTVFVD